MILRVADIPPYEMHLLPVANLSEQIRNDRLARPGPDPELQAWQRSLAALGEHQIDWDFALAS